MTIHEVEGWLQRYGNAWMSRNPEGVGELFSADASYYETPFDAPFRGREGIREYWEGVPRGQADITFHARVLAVLGTTAIAKWDAEFTRVPSGQRIELDGMFVLVFNDRGECMELREWWHRRERGAAP